MPLRSFFEGLGEFLEWTFQILPFLGNSANYLFMAIGAGLGIYWIREMRKHRKQAKTKSFPFDQWKKAAHWAAFFVL